MLAKRARTLYHESVPSHPGTKQLSHGDAPSAHAPQNTECRILAAATPAATARGQSTASSRRVQGGNVRQQFLQYGIDCHADVLPGMIWGDPFVRQEVPTHGSLLRVISTPRAVLRNGIKEGLGEDYTRRTSPHGIKNRVGSCVITVLDMVSSACD